MEKLVQECRISGSLYMQLCTYVHPYPYRYMQESYAKTRTTAGHEPSLDLDLHVYNCITIFYVGIPSRFIMLTCSDDGR